MKENTISRVMREMGAKGGKRRLETMTPEQRTEIKTAVPYVTGRDLPAATGGVMVHVGW